MAHPLQELRNILSANTYKKKYGKVFRANNKEVGVVINGRMKVFRRNASDATNYKQGDSVSVQGDVLIGRLGRKNSPKTYYV